MNNLYEMQHRRVVVLASAALVFAAFSLWSLFAKFFANGGFSDFDANSGTIYLLSCSTLIVMSIVFIMIRSWVDYQQLRRDGMVDLHTGLATAKGFEMFLRSRLDPAPVEGSYAILAFDIRRLTAINHSLGNKAGDKALHEVSRRLRLIAKHHQGMARIMGDKFILYAGEDLDQGQIIKLAQSARQSLSEPVNFEGKPIHLDVAIGAVTGPMRNSPDATEILRRIEFALIAAKAEPELQVAFYDDQTAISATRSSKIETSLRESIANGSIQVLFQPLVDSRLDRIVGAEALARWAHPDIGAVSPSEFVKIAEAAGMVSKLGNLVLRKACQSMRNQPELVLAVNISPRHFMDPNFVEDVRAILRETLFDPHRLELEITETVLLQENAKSVAIIHELRSMGISIALDDFGTGYSGLSYLNNLPVDRIKIDQSFVREVATSNSARSMITVIIALARERGIVVTVEGVEDVEQLRVLARYGYLWFQGYLFARPMAFSTLVQNIKAMPPAKAFLHQPWNGSQDLDLPVNEKAA